MIFDLRSLIILPWCILFLYLQGFAFFLLTNKTRLKLIENAQQGQVIERLRIPFFRNSKTWELKIIGIIHLLFIPVFYYTIIVDDTILIYTKGAFIISLINFMLQIVVIVWILNMQKQYLRFRDVNETIIKQKFDAFSIMFFECPPKLIKSSILLCLLIPVVVLLKLIHK